MPGRDVKERFGFARAAVVLWRQKIKPLWREYEVPLFIVFGVLALVLGFLGYREFFATNPNLPGRSDMDIAYMTLQLFRMMYNQAGTMPWMLEVARWLALLIFLYAAARVAVAIFYEQVHLLRLRWLVRGHVVLCGLGEKGSKLAGELCDHGYTVAIIDRDMSKEMAQRCKDLGAIILRGNAASPEVLRKARVDKASHLIAITGDDGVNAEIVLHLRTLVKDRDTPLLCFAHIVDRRLCNLLKAGYEFNVRCSEPLKLEFFNTLDTAARMLIDRYPPFGDAPNSGPIVVFGAGRLSESFLFLTGARWLAGHSSDGPLKIVLMDPAAKAKLEELIERYPLLKKACAVEAVGLILDSPALAHGIYLNGQGTGKVYVLMDNDRDTLLTTMSIYRANVDGDIPVIACMGQSSGLSKLLKNMGLKNLSIFEMLDTTYSLESITGGTHEALARSIHEQYVRDQEKIGDSIDTNPSMARWEELPETIRESNRNNADHIFTKLAAVDCDIELLTDASAVRFSFSQDEIERLAVMEHDRWVADNLAQGWRYAPGKKDLQYKTSPYLVPLEELPEDIRDRDRNVVRALPRFLAGAGFQIYRRRARGAGETEVCPEQKVPG